MASLVMSNISGIQNIIKDFKVKNPKIFIAIIAMAMVGPVIISIRSVIDTIETMMAGTKLQCSPLELIGIPKKEYEKLKSDLAHHCNYNLDYQCQKGFQGNRFFRKGHNIGSYARAKAITDPKFNPDNSKNFNNIIYLEKTDIFLNEIRDKGFVTPKAKDIIVFDKQELSDMMEKKAKDIYSDEGEIYTANKFAIGMIKEDIRKISKQKGEKVEESDCYTILGNIGSSFYLAIHKTNMDLYADKDKYKNK